MYIDNYRQISLSLYIYIYIYIWTDRQIGGVDHGQRLRQPPERRAGGQPARALVSLSLYIYIYVFITLSYLILS